MPAGTAVAKAESALKAEASKKGYTGRRASRYVYGALNNSGLMHGNQATQRGKRRLKGANRPPAAIAR